MYLEMEFTLRSAISISSLLISNLKEKKSTPYYQMYLNHFS